MDTYKFQSLYDFLEEKKKHTALKEKMEKRRKAVTYGESEGMWSCSLRNVNSIMVWIINRYVHTLYRKPLKNCEVTLKHLPPESIPLITIQSFYGLNRYFCNEINNKQEHLQHFGTGLKPIHESWLLKACLPTPVHSLTHWWAPFLNRGLVTGCILSFCRLLHLSAGMSCGKVNLVSPVLKVGVKKITPTKRFQHMSKSAISKTGRAFRWFNCKGGRRSKKQVFLVTGKKVEPF